MKNTIKGFLATIALILCMTNVSNAQNNNGGNNGTNGNGNNGSERPGIVIAIDNSGNGQLQDIQTGEVFQFKREGAIIAVIIGDALTFRLITLPTGEKLVVNIKPTE